jgi:hypothetical protein
MATSVIGQAIDYLVSTLAPLAAASVADALVIDSNTNDNLSPAMIWIARKGPEDRTAADLVNVTPLVGRRRVDETWNLYGFVDVKRDGTNQTVSRADAVKLYSVVIGLAITDPTLGGLLASGPWWAELTGVTLRQPDPKSTAESRTLIPFTIKIKNRYYPG